MKIIYRLLKNYKNKLTNSQKKYKIINPKNKMIQQTNNQLRFHQIILLKYNLHLL